jgi:hypothetical protein
MTPNQLPNEAEVQTVQELPPLEEACLRIARILWPDGGDVQSAIAIATWRDSHRNTFAGAALEALRAALEEVRRLREESASVVATLELVHEDRESAEQELRLLKAEREKGFEEWWDHMFIPYSSIHYDALARRAAWYAWRASRQSIAGSGEKENGGQKDKP